MLTTVRRSSPAVSWRPTSYTGVEVRSLSASSPHWAVRSRDPAVPYRAICGSVSSGTRMEVRVTLQKLINIISYRLSISHSYILSVSHSYSLSVSHSFRSSISHSYRLSISNSYILSVSYFVSLSISCSYILSVSYSFRLSISHLNSLSVSSSYRLSCHHSIHDLCGVGINSSMSDQKDFIHLRSLILPSVVNLVNDDQGKLSNTGT